MSSCQEKRATPSMCGCSLSLEALALEPPRVCAEVAAPSQVPQKQAMSIYQEKRAIDERILSLDALSLEPPRVCATVTDGDDDEHLVSATKQLLDLTSQKCIKSEEISSKELSTTSTCARSTKSATFSDSCGLWSPEDLSASEGEDDDVPLLVCQPTASTSTSRKQSRDSKAAAQQKLVWEAAYSAARIAIMQSQIYQWQMACQDVSEWHAAQMMQWEHVAFANQAGQEPKKAQLKEGDTFELESALVTCDKSKMRVEAPARGTVTRIHLYIPGSKKNGEMSVKFDNGKHCKRISRNDYHKLRKVAHC